MADTALSIITNSLQEIAVYAPGEPIDDSDAETALDLLNQMLDLWSTETLTCFATSEQSFALQVGKRTYTIGAGGDINAARPIRINEGQGAAYTKDANGMDYPVDVVPQSVWNGLGDKDSPTSTSQLPYILFYDPQFPLGKVNVYPWPSDATVTMYFDSYAQLAELASLSVPFSLPPGYKAAIQSNLAVWMAPFFKNAVVSQDVKTRAIYTKRAIRRANKRTPIGQVDSAIVSKARPTYNPYRDNRA